MLQDAQPERNVRLFCPQYSTKTSQESPKIDLLSIFDRFGIDFWSIFRKFRIGLQLDFNAFCFQKTTPEIQKSILLEKRFVFVRPLSSPKDV